MADYNFDVDAVGDSFNTCDYPYQYTDEERRFMRSVTLEQLNASGFECINDWIQYNRDKVIL